MSTTLDHQQDPAPPQRKDRTHWLYIAVIIAVFAGVAVGILAPEVGKSVGVLGTKYTMDAPLYPRVLAAHGLQSAVPETDERHAINEIIFNVLVDGIFTDPSRQRYVEIIEHLRDRGCDAVALVCTEIPLLVTPHDSPLPTLDSTRLLARAAFEVAIGQRPLPTWRGGPLTA